MASKLMHAVQYDGFGGGAADLKHREVPIPSPKKGEVLVKLEAAAVNPIDWKIQKGILRFIPFPREFPFIPVCDFAGDVTAIGEGVQKFVPGDKVVAYNPDGGALAEYAVASVSQTAPRPPEVSAADGAGLPIAACTAHQALTQDAGIKLDGSGQLKNILITAASGGVGHYAVQLAKFGKTHVTATCGTRNIEFVKSLGADEVLDYKTPEGAALKSPSGRKYDAVVHCGTGPSFSWSTFAPNLTANGIVIDISPGVLKKDDKDISEKKLVPLVVNVKAENLDYLVNLVKEGKLKTVIDSKHPLSKAEDAWARCMDGHATGKIIVEF